MVFSLSLGMLTGVVLIAFLLGLLSPAFIFLYLVVRADI